MLAKSSVNMGTTFHKMRVMTPLAISTTAIGYTMADWTARFSLTFFSIHRKPLKNGIEDTAGLSRCNHVGVQIIEYSLMILHRRRKAVARLDLSLYSL